MTYSSLFEKKHYLNKNIDSIINSEIIEYDIKSAGFNVIKWKKLLPDKMISNLENMSKKDRNVYIGKLNFREKYKNLSSDILDNITLAREWFFQKNEIEDYQVISIKNDAIFLNRTVFKTKMNDFIEFIPKNSYTSYLYLNKFEFYYNSFPVKLDIKGISEEICEYHKENGILKFILEILPFLENKSFTSIIRRIYEFKDKYLNLELPLDYYREFNEFSMFKLKSNREKSFTTIRIPEVDDINEIDITYNYVNYFIPLIRLINENS